MPAIEVPEGYSYVLAAATSTVWLNVYQMTNVSKARNAAKLPYPYAYAEKSEAASNSAANKFNCAQRAHQNTLESAPHMILSMLVAGLKHPVLAASLGGAWVVGKVLYTIGYSSGEPAKRNRPGGLISNLSMVALVFSVSYSVFEFLKEGL